MSVINERDRSNWVKESKFVNVTGVTGLEMGMYRDYMNPSLEDIAGARPVYMQLNSIDSVDVQATIQEYDMTEEHQKALWENVCREFESLAASIRAVIDSQ